MSSAANDENAVPPTAEEAYADRLARLQGKRWKKILHVQAPWHAHMHFLRLGQTLDVGCGTGRNLHHLDRTSVGVDHNAFAVQMARNSGVAAYTDGEFFADSSLSAANSFDSLLCAHMVEHLTRAEARTVLGSYMPSIKPGGRVVLITPQERGYASDATHVTFADFSAVHDLVVDLGLEPLKSYSFPFPRFAGRAFIYNEFVTIARRPAGLAS